MKKKWLAAAVCSVLSLTLLAGCETQKETPEEETAHMDVSAAPEKEEELTKVTLNEVAHSIFYAPQYVAAELGYFRDEGIDLEIVTGFGADKVMTAVLSGEADIGVMGAEASVYAYQEGASDAVVNFAQLTQRAGNFLVARQEMPGFTWEDLRGKTVLGGRKGGMPDNDVTWEHIKEIYEWTSRKAANIKVFKNHPFQVRDYENEIQFDVRWYFILPALTCANLSAEL